MSGIQGYKVLYSMFSRILQVDSDLVVLGAQSDVMSALMVSFHMRI